MILALDPSLASLGWALVAPRTGRVAELGVRIAPADTRRGRGINEDRLERLDAHAHALRSLAARRGVTEIAAETLELRQHQHGPNICAALAWGMLVGLAASLGLARPRGIRPPVWQAAIVPDAEVRERDGYAAIERALAAFIAAGDAAGQLLAIAPGQRTHALDAAGVGIFAALRPPGAMRATRPRRGRAA